MKAENTKFESRSYGLYITFFVLLIFILQLFFGFYTYCVIKPKIIQSVDDSLELFKENLIKSIERNKNDDVFYYTLFDRKKRDIEETSFSTVEGSGSIEDYNDYTYPDSEEDYEVKDVEKYCKKIKDNCDYIGPPGIPGLPGPKGQKGEKGLPGLQPTTTIYERTTHGLSDTSTLQVLPRK
ncbi:hypothetical protein FQR65_LT03209 [Abscondita terminalis]|nr:hypothetical protein FQR65_LT03209 [Abscondita terminalis]